MTRIRMFLLGLITACAGFAQPSLAMKPLIRGFIYMGDISFHRQDGGVPDNSLTDLEEHPGVFKAVVLNVAWDQLQPSQGTVDTRVIDEFLARVRDYNRRFAATPITVKLRIWGGPNAPAWAKSMPGGPVQVLHRDMGVSVGPFWSAEYLAAWKAMFDQLGTRYDREPLIQEVANAACSSITDEPFIFPGDPSSVGNLRAAGFTDAAYHSCLLNASTVYANWPNTPVEYPISPGRDTDSGRVRPDPQLSIQVMQAWRQALGPRAILSNHALQVGARDALQEIYNAISAQGRPIELQTHAPKGVDMPASLSQGVDLGAEAIEIWALKWSGGALPADPGQLAGLSARMAR